MIDISRRDIFTFSKEAVAWYVIKELGAIISSFCEVFNGVNASVCVVVSTQNTDTNTTKKP